MIITYNTLESFKVQFGDTVLAFNPVSKKSKFPSSSFGADIALVSINHPDMNGVETVSRGDKQPFVINGPGEYEFAEVFMRGFADTTEYDGETRINTVYIVTLEDMRLCFLGALGNAQLSSETLEEIGDIDILFVPIGGGGVLTPAEAHKICVSLEPRIVIPMHYTDDTLKTFLKEEGESGLKPVDKLTIKKKDIADKEGDIVLLAPVA